MNISLTSYHKYRLLLFSPYAEFWTQILRIKYSINMLLYMIHWMMQLSLLLLSAIYASLYHEPLNSKDWLQKNDFQGNSIFLNENNILRKYTFFMPHKCGPNSFSMKDNHVEHYIHYTHMYINVVYIFIYIYIYCVCVLIVPSLAARSHIFTQKIASKRSPGRKYEGCVKNFTVPMKQFITLLHVAYPWE